MITLDIPFPPISWTPSRICRNISYNPKHKEKQALMQLIATMYRAMVINEYVVLDFTFNFLPPKSASKKDRQAMLEGLIIPTRCDCTNLQKFAEDCLSKIVIEDDRLVAKISSQKLYAEKESIVILIQTLKEFKHASQDKS